MKRAALQKRIANVDGLAYAPHTTPSLSDEMAAKLRRFHHAAVEVSGTHISKRHALHLLLDAGMVALGNDVIKASRGGS